MATVQRPKTEQELLKARTQMRNGFFTVLMGGVVLVAIGQGFHDLPVLVGGFGVALTSSVFIAAGRSIRKQLEKLDV